MPPKGKAGKSWRDGDIKQPGLEVTVFLCPYPMYRASHVAQIYCQGAWEMWKAHGYLLSTIIARPNCDFPFFLTKTEKNLGNFATAAPLRLKNIRKGHIL